MRVLSISATQFGLLVSAYSVSAAVWIRGLLQHDYGVAPSQMRWFLGGLNDSSAVVPLTTRRPADVEIQDTPAGATLGLW
jgi:4,5-dihydroxyphthalate decarboxylase